MFHAWLRPPYALLAGFLALTLLPASGSLWLGWRLLEQDRQLAGRRIVERRENATDQVVTALQRAVSISESELAQLSVSGASGDAVAVHFARSGIRANPANGLLFYPDVDVPADTLPGVFAEAERNEFVAQDYSAAIALLTPAKHAAEPAIRAGARLRIARNLRKAGEVQGALQTYDEMIRNGTGQKTGRRMGHMPIDGEGGSLRALDGLSARRVFVHINNTNPILIDGSAERRKVEAVGWQVAEDGMEIVL